MIRRRMAATMKLRYLALLPILLFPLLSAPPARAGDTATAVFAELPAQPAYHAAWQTMLAGEKKVPRWLSQARATSAPYHPVRIKDKDYLAGEMCKPHDCSASRFYGMFGADKRQAWGLLVTVADAPDAMEHPARHAHYRWFGKPSAKLKAYLNDQLKADPNWK
ncbi:lysozyme inhibitor [Chromobacterium sphagni]|uniref:Lysozyme inhibitor n=2 Tax=Chromobacterium sphagni TaxID=1903179 RepID=A0A1S1X5Y3_9NEIS|nr:lysozyme inhibitor [Chromobacterium sphagni]